jgi:cytochrome c peroxidase
MVLPLSPLPSPGNRVADDERAASLGFELFFDSTLSRDGTVRCASCHLPDQRFADAKSTAEGVGKVNRNSPSLYGSAWHRWQMWDGRADSLWSAALLALESPHMMDFTRLELVHRVRLRYGPQFVELFGPWPERSAAWPQRGNPSDPAFDALPAEEKRQVNTIVANVGKALEAYQRKLAFSRGRFDDFAAGNRSALSDVEREGLAVFLSSGCGTCHGGFLFSDDAFYAIGTAEEGARGRAEALDALAASDFSMAGAFNDGSPAPIPMARSTDEGAFRTPTLRNVTRTGPWGHDGRFETLEAAVAFHWQSRRRVSQPLSQARFEALMAFLAALEATDPPLPWAKWPER